VVGRRVGQVLLDAEIVEISAEGLKDERRLALALDELALYLGDDSRPRVRYYGGT
jgi:hypothetical protein